MSPNIKGFITSLVLFFLAGCEQPQEPLDFSKTPKELSQHTQIFEKSVVKVTDRVHVAIGYGLANSIMIEGDDGLIIVDTMETVEEGNAVLNEFRRISQKPIKAIIYTHNHADHVFGQ